MSTKTPATVYPMFPASNANADDNANKVAGVFSYKQITDNK